MSEALYRKYRPRGWDEVIGQEHVVRTLRNAIAKDRVGHAYLFAGPRGTGKTTMARILAKAVNCLAADPAVRPCNACGPCQAVNEGRFLDLIEMDAASNTGVDDVRELRDKIGFAPSQGRLKVYIIDEVHMLSTPAFNALLKTLEEPPSHAMFVLATTEIHKIPATVLSRCQRHEFRRVGVSEIVANLRSIVDREGWQSDDEALLLIAREATGSIRDAQSLLDQLASTESRITLQLAQPVLGTATNQAVLELIDAIRADETARALDTLRRTLDSGVDARTLARQIVEYLRGLIWIKMGNADQVEVPKEVRERMRPHAAAFSVPTVIRMARSFNGAAADTRGGWQPSLTLELALAEAFENRGESAKEGRDLPGGNAVGERRASIPRGGSEEPPSASRDLTGSGARTKRGPTRLYQGAADAKPAPDPGIQAPSPSGNDSGDTPQTRAINLETIIRSWKEIRGALKRTHPTVDGLLNSCKPIEVRGDELVLGFQSEAVRALMESPEKLEAARKAIASVLGGTVRLRCVVISARGKVPPNISQDGMVATALHQGGEIVDIQE